ncbi:MAG TPA: hypothetical protein VMN03_03060 [Burkholderiales bacterium]|nr:hypothetical protein [Burkholderiales bacterium]
MTTDRLPDDSAILIVAFFYAPMLNARAFRWTALAEAWAAQGKRVSVVCSWAPGLPRVEMRNGVAIYRTGNRGLERLRALYAHRRRQAASPRSPVPASPASGLASGIRGAPARWLLHGWRNVYWPDGSCLWYFAAMDRARALLRKTPGAALITVSPTFTAVAVGYALNRTSFRPGRWLIDMGDPFCFAEEAPPNNFRLYRGLNRWFERRCFQRADAVSVTNAPTAERYGILFPEIAAKIAVIPPLLSGKSAPRPANPPASATHAPQPVRLVYLGTLYRTIRRPDFLLALFAGARRRGEGAGMELHFYGDVDQCRESFRPYSALVGTALFLHGVVPRDEALRAIEAASILVNIGNDTPYQLPSKLVEYAATGKPILCISSIENDSSIRFLQGYPASLPLLDRQGPPTAGQLDAFTDFLSSGARPVQPELLRAWLSPYRLTGILGRYGELLSP